MCAMIMAMVVHLPNGIGGSVMLLVSSWLDDLPSHYKANLNGCRVLRRSSFLVLQVHSGAAGEVQPFQAG